MYPVLFEIPFLGWPISSFGAMMAIAFLVGFWITRRGMEERGLDPELASNLLLWTMIGGVVGSKVYYTIVKVGGVVKKVEVKIKPNTLTSLLEKATRAVLKKFAGLRRRLR